MAKRVVDEGMLRVVTLQCAVVGAFAGVASTYLYSASAREIALIVFFVLMIGLDVLVGVLSKKKW